MSIAKETMNKAYFRMQQRMADLAAGENEHL